MKKQNGLAPILIVLLIALAVGGYLLYQKQTKSIIVPQSATFPVVSGSAETANWKTYTNNKYNFTFNYPNSWIAEEDDGKKSRSVPLIFLRPKSLQTQDKTYGEIIVWIYNNIKTIEEYTAQLCDSPGVCVASSNVKNIKVANLDAFNIKNIPGPLPSEEVVFKTGNSLIVFHFNYQGESYNNYSNKESKQVFDQILSTFKFLDQNQTRNTSPGGSFSVTEQAVGDTQIITIKDKQGNIVVDDLVSKNSKEIGYNVKFKCQCGTSFKKWVNNATFSIKIVNGGGEEYEYLVDAKNGKVDESSFKRIK